MIGAALGLRSTWRIVHMGQGERTIWHLEVPTGITTAWRAAGLRPPPPLLSLEEVQETPFWPFKPIDMESRWILGVFKSLQVLEPGSGLLGCFNFKFLWLVSSGRPAAVPQCQPFPYLELEHAFSQAHRRSNFLHAYGGLLQTF